MLHVGGSGWYKGVSKNRATPKWIVYNGKPYWFGGTTIFGNIHKVLQIRKLDVLPANLILIEIKVIGKPLTFDISPCFFFPYLGWFPTSISPWMHSIFHGRIYRIHQGAHLPFVRLISCDHWFDFYARMGGKLTGWMVNIYSFWMWGSGYLGCHEYSNAELTTTC